MYSSKQLIIVCLGIIALILGAVFAQRILERNTTTPITNSVAQTAEKFIVPLTQIVQSNPPRLVGTRIALEKDLRDFGEKTVTSGALTKYGIFVKDLTTGATIGIHESTDFSPASLLKLPIAMWYFKKAQDTPDYLNNEIQFTGPKGTSIEQYPGRKSITIGQTYTLEGLIELMLQESDNDATSVLAQYSGGAGETNKVYEDLGIKDVGDYNTYIIDVHTYTAFFQVLYNAHYLNREYSNKLLELMTHASFVDGLVAGVPSGVAVAHKFGERTIDATKHLVQLHDCGIVYAERPYLLCVMTQAQDYKTASEFIANVSKMAHQAFGL